MKRNLLSSVYSINFYDDDNDFISNGVQIIEVEKVDIFHDFNINDKLHYYDQNFYREHKVCSKGVVSVI